MVSIKARKEAAREIAKIVPLAMRTIAAQLRRGEHQIDPPHFRLLGMLAHCPCNMSELAEKHAVSPATISNSITILEERGWVKRIRSPHDRRVVIVELTPEGSDVLVDVHRHAEEHLAALLASLSEEEYNALLAGLAALRKAFSHIPSHCMDEEDLP
jgi:DNA-binding MarR family transcriptional regulator